MENKELLFSVTKKDFDIEWFSGTGAGGQYRNKHKNCCRMKHRESGVTSTGQSNRSQKANLREAFLNITNSQKFKQWLKIKTSNQLEQQMTIEQKVNEALKEENLRIEYLEEL